MKAAYYEGDKKINIGESKLNPPGPRQVQLKVAYAGICGTDYHIYLGDWDWRIKTPQVIGHEMSGKVIQIGDGTEGFKIGDKVVVRPVDPCRKCKACKLGYYNLCYNISILGMDTPGAFQGIWTVPAYTLHHLPDSIDMRHAAVIEPVAVALHAVRRGRVTDKDYVVVLGAGPIGMLVALQARMKGARVLLSEINKFRENLARELGMEVVNPLEKDLLKYVAERTEKANANVVFEVSASADTAKIMTELVGLHGRIVIVGQFTNTVKVDLRRFIWWECQVLGSRNYEVKDFESAISLVASGRLPLDQLISDIRPLEQLQATFEEIERGTNFLKILLKCSD